MSRLVTLLMFLTVFPSGVRAQSGVLTGTVVDAGTGEPLADILVRLETNGSVTVSDEDGEFLVRGVSDGEHILTFTRLGYRRTQISVTAPADEPIRVELPVDPIELEGFDVTAESWANRLAAVEAKLDRRLAVLPGHSRAVDAERIRPYDEIHDSDPWKLFWDELRVGWVFEQGVVHAFGRKVAPEVYIDERRRWLFQVVHVRPSSFCRIELYVPFRHSYRLNDRPPQIRAYTCQFLARVVEGSETLSERLNTGDLIAGPPGP